MRKKKIAAFGVAFALVYAIGCVMRDASAINGVDEIVQTEGSPTPAPVVAEKKWTVTNSWSGNGVKDTENFAVTENTRITCETPSVQGIFHYIEDSKGASVSLPINMQGIGKDVSYLHITPGQYSLKINTANTPWKITVEQQQ